MASMAPDWTPATSGYAPTPPRMRTKDCVNSQGFGTSLAGSPLFVGFRNALEALQKRPIAMFSTLLLVRRPIASTISSMASDLLNFPNVDGY